MKHYDKNFIETTELSVKTDISIKLKFWRETCDLTQKQLAEYSGVTARTIGRCENVNLSFIPSLSTIIKLANALQIPFIWLICTFNEED